MHRNYFCLVDASCCCDSVCTRTNDERLILFLTILFQANNGKAGNLAVVGEGRNGYQL